MKLTIVMDNGTRYKLSEDTTKKCDKADIGVVLDDLNLLQILNKSKICFSSFTLDDNITQIMIRVDKVSSYEWSNI